MRVYELFSIIFTIKNFVLSFLLFSFIYSVFLLFKYIFRFFKNQIFEMKHKEIVNYVDEGNISALSEYLDELSFDELIEVCNFYNLDINDFIK